MTTYNTGNPVPSTAVQDLYDNNQTEDEWVNSDATTTITRTGKSIYTAEGLSQLVANMLANGTLISIGPYTAGLTVGNYNQIFTYLGEWYRALPTTVLPYTMTGTPATDLPFFGAVGDGILRNDLASTALAKGVGIVSGSVRMVDSVAVLRTVPKNLPCTAVRTLGYYGKGLGGAGDYWYDSSDTTTLDNGVTVIVNPTDSGRWKLITDKGVSLMQGGATGDGVTDDSVRIQAVIDASKGKLVIVDHGHTFYCTGVILSGATYNNTTLRFDGKFKMKPGASSFGGAWVCLLLKDCDGVTINPKVDGNRSAMPQVEQIFCVGIAGGSNHTIPTADFTEIRGDGLYVGQSDWLANSTIPSNIRCGRITGQNSANDGRNTVSIISVNGFDLEYIYSNGVGGTVNGFIMPGGIDIEPDYGYEICTNIWIGYADITTAGTSGVGVFGKSVSGNDANRDWNCTDIRIDDFRLLKTGTSGSAISAGPFTRVADLRIKGQVAYNTTRGQGMVFDQAQRVTADLTFLNVTVGLIMAPTDFVTDFDITVNVQTFSTAGLVVCAVSGGRFRGRINRGVAGAFGVQAYNYGRVVTQQNVAYEIDMPYDSAMVRAFRNEPGNLVTFGTGCIVRDCDWTGYGSPSATIDALIPKKNVRGLMQQVVMPANGSWFLGDFVEVTTPTIVANRLQTGWYRLNTGTNNVINTDWAAAWVATV